MNKVLDIISLVLLFILVTTQTSFSQVGEATYYHSYYEGRKTSSGEVYRGNRFTAASVAYRTGTILKVTRIIKGKKGKSVIVVVNDRGSFSHRNVDLSVRAFETIAKRSNGRIKVEIIKVGFDPKFLKKKKVKNIKKKGKN